MTAPFRTSGFRCSALDAVVLIVGVAAGILLWPRLGPMSGAFPFAVGHFFLFCKIFRIHRTKELVWVVATVLHVAVWVLIDDVAWLRILALQTPLTLLLIGLTLRGPWYHGICAPRIDQRLDDCISGRI